MNDLWPHVVHVVNDNLRSYCMWQFNMISHRLYKDMISHEQIHVAGKYN